MSWTECDTPGCDEALNEKAIRYVIRPKPRDLGGFSVRRSLPAIEARSVGPFVFFDQMGPAEFAPGTGIDVRPHPHIGLATLTWLVEGAIMHRDSLGSVQEIRPGAVNWMTAGHGIVHSERTPVTERAAGHKLYGLQIWMALPKDRETMDPAFDHYPADSLPTFEGPGMRGILVAGEGWGKKSPVTVQSRTLYADISLEDGASVSVPADPAERAIYMLDGAVTIGGERHEPGAMLVLEEGVPVTVAASGGPARLMVLGGDPLDGPRRMYWNFVATDEAMIEEAKERWREGRFDPVPGDDEFIPLPER
ncbi:pirin family protein [Pseudokordiimonas caeni]|uniref:pirin family protein n=1 Tax=Pseudokordiimonas caeni TaxID=2997908 RepID=UPI0028113796|nr:pirin family protein [Pseudokordiimonas caeni]